MPALSLSLLGPCSVKLDGRPLSSFRTKSVQALLIYLTCQPEKAHQREHLMTLLWPGLPQQSAQANFRQTLYLLRKAIPELPAKNGEGLVPFLLIDRRTVQVNPSGSYWLDALAFKALLAGSQERWLEAVALYRGDFIVDFYLPGSAAYEAWVLAQREELRRRALETLEVLAANELSQNNTQAAEGYARRQIEIDSLQESAHRQLMEALARSGQRTKALNQFEVCSQILMQDLGVEPSAKTRALYEAILAEEIGPLAESLAVTAIRPVSVELPDFLAERVKKPDAGYPVFVGREPQLKKLHTHLDITLKGQGRVLFVCGDAGSGKTALMQAFANQATARQPDLLVAWGTCNAFSGRGDPYLPFRRILSQLTGEVKPAWSAGTLGHEQARRLWIGLPQAVATLADQGPDLIDTFVPGKTLLTRLRIAAPGDLALQQRLLALIERETEMGDEAARPQLHEQIASFLGQLAEQRTILLLVDDLQWVDNGSADLLFHLGRQFSGFPVMLVGAYRPEEIIQDHTEERHPLAPVLDEFQRVYGNIYVDLDEARDRQFVDAFLDSEPNRLDAPFRETLFRHTGGHALFTVELLRELQERGDLFQDGERHWVAGSTLDWDVLPARINGVIAARIDRLSDELRNILTVAAVEGEEFTAQVVARAQQLQERLLLSQLSQELAKQHQLIKEGEDLQIGDRLLSRYRFSHALFQQYLYDEISTGERRLLHGQVGTILEELYGEQSEIIFAQLARHYEEAGQSQKAVAYLQQAGDQARLLYAQEEAIAYYRRALALLKEEKAYKPAAQTLMKLGLVYYNAFDYRQASQAYQEGLELWQKVRRSRPFAPPSPAPHALRIAYIEPESIDPTFHYWGFEPQYINLLFRGLVQLGVEGEVLPALAQRWEMLKGGTEYLFHLRSDAYWSDGAPVIAQDFEYAWKRILTPATKSPNANVFHLLKNAQAYHQGVQKKPDLVGVKALDDQTLLVELEKPASYFFQLLTTSWTFPIPQHIVTASGDEWTKPGNLVVNGPFTLEKWVPAQSITLVRNPKYSGTFHGNVEQIEFTTFPLSRAMAFQHKKMDLYKANEVDINDVTVTQFQSWFGIMQRYATEYVLAPDYFTRYVRFDMSRSPFNDRLVRLAFVLAIDREILANVMMGSFVLPATGGIVPPGLPGYSEAIGLPCDPIRARQLLAEAGYSAGNEFPIVYINDYWLSQVVEYLCDQWQEILGIEVRLSEGMIDTHQDLARQEVIPHIVLNTWLHDYPDPKDYLPDDFEPELSGWKNKAYGELLAKAAQTMDQQLRLKLYQEADQILINEAVFMPLHYVRVAYLVKPWVKNFNVGPSVNWFLTDVVIEPH